ncbi:MAG TPA: hypothetical protein VLA16_05090 [Ideonella sp.]|nr:hypothetical protein [Ideonella sp.]
MGDVPTWVWQVLAAIVGGLGLGVGLGAVLQRGKKTAAKGAGSSSALSTLPVETEPAKPARPAADNTPQHRLLERLRENNLQLSAQLRSTAEEHARAMLDKTQEQQAERFRQERQLEELRQAHSAELSHLMSVLVEQIDTLHKEHANHVKALEAEIERARGERRDAAMAPTAPAELAPASPPGPGPRASAATRPTPPAVPPAAEHEPTQTEGAEFAPTQMMDPARQP